NNGLLPKIFKVMQTCDADCHLQCCLAFSVLVAEGTKAQILSLLAEKPMPALPAALTHTDHECAYYALFVIYKLLSIVSGNQLDTLKEEAKECGVVGHIKKLQENTNENVHKLARIISSKYFKDNDDKIANTGCAREGKGSDEKEIENEKE
ncbi:hypothetical protein PMAYCL1PPCAC_25598, partial [Pristionchus mayeri]